MHVALIGGTGGIGSLVLAELVTREHPVLAIVRRPDAIEPAPGVTPVVADIYDTELLTRSLRGTDAVVSAFNPGWDDPQLYDRYLAGSRSARAAAADAGIRALFIGGASSLYDRDGRQLIETTSHPDQFMPGIRAARDFYEELRVATELDWAFLSPPPGFDPGGDASRRGSYRTGSDTPLVDAAGQYATISGPDLAGAIVDELETPRQRGQRFTVAY